MQDPAIENKNPVSIKKVMAIALCGYVALYLLAQHWQPVFAARGLSTAVADVPARVLLKFSAAGAFVVCTGLLLWTRKSCRLDWRKLYGYMGATALVGPVGEVVFNNTFRLLSGGPLWQYHILPVHRGDTSRYSFFLWSLYGVYLYFLHRKTTAAPGERRDYLLALLIAVDAIFLEFVTNIGSLFYLRTLVFYYFPSDIGHLTTALVSPFYFLGGLALVHTLQRFIRDPVFFGSLGYLVSFTFFFLR
ncbi:MAG TPA: hypothetical protein PLF22_08295 [Pseudomonadales bacterium]|nr:hypothetical protein [Pseudomonadales bacterium]